MVASGPFGYQLQTTMVTLPAWNQACGAFLAVLFAITASSLIQPVHGDTILTSGESYCWWKEASSALVRDILYIDGGQLAFLSGTQPNPDKTPRPDTLYLNLSLPFSNADNSTTPPMFGAIHRDAVYLYDGFMFANDYSFILYGGFLPYSNSIPSLPTSDEAQQYDNYLQGPVRASFAEGYSTITTPAGTDTSIVSGAGVNVRQLNMSFFFSGLHSDNWGQILGPGTIAPTDNVANVTSQQLISVDLSDQLHPVWVNETASSIARGRANPEMVFVPVGEQGILVVVGGALWPDWMWPIPTEAQVLESKRTVEDYVTSVEVYDIASKTWYLQNTTGDIPPGMTQFCSTLSSAADGSSHQIYVYGGYNGQSTTNSGIFSDDVYVLSLPSFTWVKAYTAPSISSGRKSHNCIQVLPDQMFVIGGAGPNEHACLSDGFVKVFNLNTLEFQEAYDPAQYSEYQVPDVVISAIGGGPTGGATKTAPATWADSDLRTIFATALKSTAPTWYPYGSATAPTASPSTATSTPTTTGTSSATPTPHSSSGVPTYVPPLLGAILGSVLIVGIGCTIFYCMRRRRHKPFPASTSNSTDFSDLSKAKPSRLHSWLHGVSPDLGSGTNTGSEMGYAGTEVTSPIISTVSPMSPTSHHHMTSSLGSIASNIYTLEHTGTVRHELPDTQVIGELDGNSIPSEKKDGIIEKSLPVPSYMTPIAESPNVNLPVMSQKGMPVRKTSGYGFPSNQQNPDIIEEVGQSSASRSDGQVHSPDIKPDTPMETPEWWKKRSFRKRK